MPRPRETRRIGVPRPQRLVHRLQTVAAGAHAVSVQSDAIEFGAIGRVTVKRAPPIDVPIDVLGLAVVTALVLGVLAGLYPALRAARLNPADAVRPA